MKANPSSAVILGEQHVTAEAFSRHPAGRYVARPRNPDLISRDAEIYARSKNGSYNLAVIAKDYKLTAQRVGQIIAAKDAKVYAAWKSGRYTLADLADEYHLTPEQVGEILTARHPEPASEEAGRGVLRARLELLMVAIQQVIEEPGYRLGPHGGLAKDDDGQPVLDVMARIEAMKLQLSAYERASRLDAGDKSQPKQVRHEFTVAQQEAAADIARRRDEMEARERRLEDLARRAAVVPGEVVAELPAGDGET